MLEHFNKPNIFETNNLTQKRKSLDTQQNKLGERLLALCISNNLTVLNGRSGSNAGIGKFTFRNSSIIDYVIVSADSAKYVQNFQIIDLDPLFSDGHSLLIFKCYVTLSQFEISNKINQLMQKSGMNANSQNFVTI